MVVHQRLSPSRSRFTTSLPPPPSPPPPPPLPPGDYEIAVKFNEQHIPDSPFLVPVVAPVNDARRLTVTGLQVRHEETPPHPACPALLKGSGAQLHKMKMNMIEDGWIFLFPYRAEVVSRARLIFGQMIVNSKFFINIGVKFLKSIQKPSNCNCFINNIVLKCTLKPSSLILTPKPI